MRKEQSLRSPEDNNKRSKICVLRVPEEKKKEGGAQKVFQKIRAENFPNLPRNINI